MGNFAFVVAFFVGSVILVIVIAMTVSARKKKRTEHLRRIAAELSFDFVDSDDELLARLGEFPLFSRGGRRTTENVLHGTSNDIEVSIFDYHYTMGSGKNQTTYYQTAICFHSGQLNLPNFELRPEHWFHKIGGMFGYQDIDFADYPEFSRSYLLRSDDEQGVRDLFTAAVIERLEGPSDICAEGRGDRLVVYRAGKRVKPPAVREFLTTGFSVYSALTNETDV